MFDLMSHLKSEAFTGVGRSFLRNAVAALIIGGMLAACGGGSGGSITGAGSNNTGGSGSGTDGGTSTGGGSGTDGTAVVKIGNGTGIAFVEGTAGADTTSLQSGGTATITVNLVDGDNTPITTERIVSFSSNCVGSGLASLSNASATTASGLASTVYTALGCSGDDVVTVRATIDSVEITATVTLSIAEDQVLAVEFVSISSPQLSLAGIGGQETAVVTFKLVGAQSAPIIGETVSFSTSTSVGGIALAAGTDTDVTDSNGLVTTVLQSGTVAAPVSVTATHDATGIQGTSDDIAISTGVPVANRLSLSVSEFNPKGAFNTDGVELSFNIIASDQFGNDAPDGTQISFATPETGNIDSSCILVSGRCSVTWISASPRPADLRFTVLAHTVGAEDFNDLNGNNVFDGSDSFTAGQDLGEAFVDEDESGGYDIGEFFIDSNSNTVRDTGDGVWNGPCMSGINASALCPGAESIVIFETATVVMPTNTAQISDFGTFPALNTTIDLASGNPVQLDGLRVSDSNGNSLPSGTTIDFSLNISSGDLNLGGSLNNTVPNNAINPNGPFSIVLQSGAGNTSTAVLTMRVTVPDESPQNFTWLVDF